MELFCSFKTYKAVILGGSLGAYLHVKPSHAKDLGEHGSPTQFFFTENFIWMVIMALAEDTKYKWSKYTVK